jgi:hypothetical protein
MLKEAAKGVLRDAGRWLEGKRKAIDLWGNDWYLAHIVRTVRWWSEPTHVTVLGDLLGSQWVTKGEFEKRAARYWDIVMRGLERVPDRIYGVEEGEVLEERGSEESQEGEMAREVVEEGGGDAPGGEVQDNTDEGDQGEEEEVKPLRTPSWGGTTEVLGADQSWETRVINIAGNHDVGYAGDLDPSRVARFEKAFGSVNWDIWFTLPSNTTSDDAPPALRLVILNSMNIDTPAWSTELQTETYSFMNHIITSSRSVDDKTHATIVLTHIPLEKQAGVCVDSPYFDFFESGHGVKEQNMLSEHSSKTILEGVFGMGASKDAAGQGMGRRGIILNGHDHAGCDVMHFIRQDGVEDVCTVEEVKSEEAYWPTPTPTETAVTATMHALETSSANEMNPFIESTSPAPDQISRMELLEDEAYPASGWTAHRYPHRPYSITHDSATNTSSCTRIASSPHIREITLRSMMGEFSGYAGFLSAWFDPSLGERGEWVFEFNTCGLGVQHWWWGVHSLDFGIMVCFFTSVLVRRNERKKSDKMEMLGRQRIKRMKWDGMSAEQMVAAVEREAYQQIAGIEREARERIAVEKMRVRSSKQVIAEMERRG